MSSEEASTEVASEYLDMVMVCPFEAGKKAGAMALRDVLASEVGPKILPTVLKNIENAKVIAQLPNMTPERATIIAFGGAIVENETGGIARQPETPEVTTSLQAQLQAAEKKSARDQTFSSRCPVR